MISADSFYRIGKSHRVCQDYAEHICGERTATAWLSDGCSSSPDSDWGARFLIRSARSLIGLGATTERIANSAGMMTYATAVDFEAINATLIEVAIRRGELFASVVGDGVVVARRKDGVHIIIEIEYPSGAPFYPRYALSGVSRTRSDCYSQYLEKFGGDYLVKQQEWVSGQPSTTTIERRTLPICPTAHTDVFAFSLDAYDLLAAFSDGVHTFTKPVTTETSRRVDAVPLSDVLSELLAFKSFKGDFVARRCAAAFKHFASVGWAHTDDFCMAAVFCDEEPTT